MKSRLALLVIGLASALAAPSAVIAAAPEIKIENVRVGFGDGLARNAYKIGTWTPVWVDLKGGPARFEGTLEFTVADDTNTPTTIRRGVNVPANEMATVLIYVRPGSRFGEMTARVVAGRSVKDSWSGGTVESYGQEMGLILHSGQAPGLTEVKDLPKYATASGGTTSRLMVAPVPARDGLPGRWYGFDAVDAVVLDTNDPATLTRLRESAALIEWVRQGGHLIVAVGQNWQNVLDSPIGAILPATPAGRIDLADPGLIDQFAGTAAKPLLPADSKVKLRVTKFEDWEKRGGVPLASASATPLVLRGAFGFGRVTMIGIDVDQKPFSTWEDKRLLWDKLLDLRHRGGDGMNNPGAANVFYNGRSGELAASLHDSLQRFPGVQLVPFGWVAFFVFLYILLIGPGDYFFLRKVVKRMELTWVTFPLIVLTVSALAYGAAYYFKGTELRINKVDAVDIDQTTNLTRGWSWVTLFSPQNRDYSIGFAPLPPDAPPPEDPIASATGPRNTNIEQLTSWFGTPEGNQGGGGGMAFNSGYQYAPESEPEELTGVRVNIWSTKSFTGRWSASVAAPILECDLTPDGPDRLRGTVTNVSRRPLKRAALFYGRYVYPLNDVAPGATATLGESQALTGYMDGLTQGMQSRAGTYYVNGRAVSPSESDALANDRPDIVRSLMFHAGLGAKAVSLPSFALREMDLTDQLELRRPILVADVEGPAAQLRLGGAGSKPKMVQTTVLRVILPFNTATKPGKP